MSDRKRFDGKVVIITGAGNGIGKGYASAFGREGASVAVADIDAQAAAATAKSLADSGIEALDVAVDVADEASVQAMVQACVERFGGVDVLVNNAGLHMGQYNLCSTLPVDDWHRLLDVNVIAPVLCSRHCRASMASRGGGVILNQSSSSAHQGVGAYSVSKLALEAVTLSLATEFAEDNIRVVGVAPGMIGSDALLERLEEHNKQLVLKNQLLKRFATIDDLFGVVLVLCSDEASFVTGRTYPVDGGFPRIV